MEALYKKFIGNNTSPLWLKKQIEWHEQGSKSLEKEIRRLLALDIKKKTPYQAGTKLIREYKGKRYDTLAGTGSSF